MILLIFAISLVYNAVFIEEFAWGKVNGSARSLVYRSAEFIRSNPDIKKVIVYNDNGAYEIKKTGKYFRRLYAVPGFEDTYKKVFADFDGHILVINIPEIYPNSFYSNYLSACQVIFSDISGQVSSKIYHCLPLKK